MLAAPDVMRPCNILESKPLAAAPLVSLVVVNYNYGRFLDCCLQSIADQTYQNIECIIVDNASTDGSRDRILAFLGRAKTEHPDFSVQTCFLEANLHQTGGSIEGFRRSKGAFVIFVDADDYLLPPCVEAHVRTHLSTRIAVGLTSVDMYQTVNENIVTSTGSGAAHFLMTAPQQSKAFFRTGDLRFVDDATKTGLPTPLTGDDVYFVRPELARQWPWSQTTGICYRREMVDLMFDGPLPLTGNTDAYLAHGIASITGGIIIDKPLAVYRTHGSNIFGNNPPINNLRCHDIEKLKRDNPKIINEAVKCHLRNIRFFSKRIDFDAYIHSIELLSEVYPALKPEIKTFSSYILSFVVENHATLAENFGQAVVDQWLTRRTGGVRNWLKRQQLHLAKRLRNLREHLVIRRLIKASSANKSNRLSG